MILEGIVIILECQLLVVHLISSQSIASMGNWEVGKSIASLFILVEGSISLLALIAQCLLVYKAQLILFGHPTDQLLTEIDSEISQWNSQSVEPVIKIFSGHLPFSFSALSFSEKSLKDIFLKHSQSVYLCGHFHIRFRKNFEAPSSIGSSFLPIKYSSNIIRKCQKLF